ncbi:hypothetical protein KAR10_01260 [bacterium]|nr:hypothetical protein [bacterium]
MFVRILIFFNVWLCVTVMAGYAEGVKEKGVGMPLKYISSYEEDFNGDKLTDIAMLVETVRGRELIVLNHNKRGGYEAFLVSSGKPGMYLQCFYGDTVIDVHTAKKYKTVGVYLRLKTPESAAVAYFWNGRVYQEVWIED